MPNPFHSESIRDSCDKAEANGVALELLVITAAAFRRTARKSRQYVARLSPVTKSQADPCALMRGDTNKRAVASAIITKRTRVIRSLDRTTTVPPFEGTNVKPQAPEA
jgi:hypothetical protein